MPKLTDLPGTIMKAVEDISNQEAAQAIGRKMMYDAMPPNRYSGRLRNSGFLFIDGNFVEATKDPLGGIDYKKSRHLGRRRPPAPMLHIVPGKNIHQINFQYHTPAWWKKGLMFDYATKIMGSAAAMMTQFRFGANQAGRYFKEVAEEKLRRRLG